MATTKDALDLFVGELERTKFREWEFDKKSEIELKADVQDAGGGIYRVTLQGPGGRYKFGIGKVGLTMFEQPQSSSYWMKQVYKVYQKVKKEVDSW